VIFALRPKLPSGLGCQRRDAAAGRGRARVGIEARNVSSSDILLALRLNESDLEVELPLSASVRAEISSDARCNGCRDRWSPMRHRHRSRRRTDQCEDRSRRHPLQLDARQRALVIPFQVQAGGNQFTLRAALEAPADQSGVWLFSMARGDPVIDPIILSSAGKSDEEGIALIGWRCARASIRCAAIDLDQGDIARIDTRASTTSRSRSPAASIIPAPSRIWRSASRRRACRWR